MNFVGIIPARYESTRFPGKPLVDIAGKSMIQRVYEQSLKSFDQVYVATDDLRIEKAVIDFGGKVVMTSPNHKSGTDRCNEALDKIHKCQPIKFDVVINIQGDEPFIHPEQLNLLKSCFSDVFTEIATLVSPIESTEELFNPNNPKVTLNSKKEAIYFSRSPIPYVRNHEQSKWITKNQFFKHIGIYGYRQDILKKICELKQSSLEIAESLEQLRWIENGLKIRVEQTNYQSIPIDTPEDLQKTLNQILNK